jgi:hypothetical protein
MPFETQLIIGGIVAVFAAFMVVLAWVERYSKGGSDGTHPAE